MRHVVMFSGGVGSWMAAKRVAERHGTADVVRPGLTEYAMGIEPEVFPWTCRCGAVNRCGNMCYWCGAWRPEAASTEASGVEPDSVPC